MNEGKTPLPPDITRDRMVLVWGGTTFPICDVMVAFPQIPSVWVTKIPIEKHPNEPENAYPHESAFRVACDVVVGTVDEIVENFRDSLIRCWETLACKQPDGSYGVIPSLGEASFRKQTELLERHGLNKFCKPVSAFKVDPKVFQELQDRRNRLNDFTPKQDAFEREHLMRLVGDYLSGGRYLRGGESSSPPTDDTKSCQQLIDALTILRDDQLALEKQRQDEAETRQCPTACAVQDAMTQHHRRLGKHATKIHLSKEQLDRAEHLSFDSDLSMFGMEVVVDNERPYFWLE